MSPTFVHIGDFHAGPNERNGDRFRALDQVIAHGRALPSLSAWLVPGDLNHARMSIEDRNALAERLILMGDAAPVIACDGNHDLPGELEIFARLRANYPIHVVHQPSVLRVSLRTGGFASLFVLPYPTKAGLAARGVAPGDIVASAADALAAIFQDAAIQLADARAHGDLTLMIGHVNVAGAMTAVGQPNIGHEIELDASHLATLQPREGGSIYIGLNHIHKAQEIHGAVYPGSLCRLDWGEIDPKSFVAIHYDESPELPPVVPGGATFRVERVPVDVPPMYHVEGELTRDGFTWQVKDGPEGAVLDKPASWRGLEVRCRYTYKQAEKSVLTEALIYAEFAEAKRLEVDPVAIPDTGLRSPAVAAAKTLTEKVQAWFHVKGLTPTAGMVNKLARLEHGDPLQLLDEIDGWLVQIEAHQEEETVAA